jgi:hypothetical protein
VSFAVHPCRDARQALVPDTQRTCWNLKALGTGLFDMAVKVDSFSLAKNESGSIASWKEAHELEGSRAPRGLMDPVENSARPPPSVSHRPHSPYDDGGRGLDTSPKGRRVLAVGTTKAPYLRCGYQPVRRFPSGS